MVTAGAGLRRISGAYAREVVDPKTPVATFMVALLVSVGCNGR